MELSLLDEDDRWEIYKPWWEEDENEENYIFG